MDKTVSVLIVTYNHEKYIAQAVASALQQEVNFQYEIVIGDDCSTDQTRDILRKLSRAHPERIRLLLREKRGADLLGKSNFVETLKACQGQYVAMLEGDDYWTNPYKLQKQVDFLADHPDCVICFHNALLVYEDGSAPPRNMLPEDQKEISTIEDLFRRNFIPTCSLIFKRGLFGELPQSYYESLTADWLLSLLNAEHGSIGYVNEVMAVYRIHRTGQWSQQDYLTSLEKELEIYKAVKAHFGSKYSHLISEVVAERFLVLAREHASRGDLGKAKSFALKSFSERLGSHRAPSRNLCSTLLRLYVPGLHKTLRSLRRT